MLQITEPVLLLDTQKCRRNIEMMIEKARRNQVRLRPHFKTHQSQQVGRWYRGAGVGAITVSSLRMAKYFAADGWQDITVAFPINILEINTINALAQQITLNLATLDANVTDELGKQLQFDTNLHLKIDIGYHRTGLLPQDKASIDAILKVIDKYPKLHFRGFLGHAGHSYGARATAEILEIHKQSIALLTELKAHYSKQYPDLELSTGDTPTCSVAEDFSRVDEIRPGNFVFYDLTQNLIGSCRKEQIAVALACPVVAKHADRHEIILYGGGVHFSKDFLDLHEGRRSYGELVHLGKNGWSAPIEGCYLTRLSQEHGTLRVDAAHFKRIKIGDVVTILPVHSCMTANAMRAFRTLDGQWLDHMNGEDIRAAALNQPF